MANLYDVAELAGVSKTLVSRVINNQKGVSAEARQRIYDAMKKLNYKPNAIARSLVLKETFIIGVLLDTLCEPFFFDMIKGIEHAVDNSQYDVIFCSARNQLDLKRKYINFLSQGRVDGFIIYNGRKIDDLLKELSELDFPFVVVENYRDDIIINNIVVANEYGSKLAVDHLYDIGCRNIYHVTGDMHTKVSEDRRDGFIKAMQNHNLSVNDNMILNAGFTVESGYASINGFIEKNGLNSIPDAFYFAGDAPAFGGMMALEDAGIRVPEDVKIVGFDNDKPYNIDRYLKKLTTLNQPLFQMGVSAVEMLISNMKNPSAEKKKLVFYPELIIRDTTNDK